MEFDWFDFAWPWIGLGFATVIIVLLFATNRLRADTAQPRWRDLRWLSFLAVAAYLVHQVEEYGITATGVQHAFPSTLCSTLGQPPYPGCAIPPAFYLAVNISLVWVAAPIAALLSRRLPLAGLTLWGVIAVNAIVHTAPALATQRYDAGLLTATLIFAPLTVLAARALLTEYAARAALIVFAAGIFMHAVLGGGVALFLHGEISVWLLVAAQPAGIIIGNLAVGLFDSRLRAPRMFTNPHHHRLRESCARDVAPAKWRAFMGTSRERKLAVVLSSVSHQRHRDDLAGLVLHLLPFGGSRRHGRPENLQRAGCTTVPRGAFITQCIG